MPSLLICTSANAEAHNRCPSHVEGHNASSTISIVFFVTYHIADRRFLLGVTPAHQTNLLFYKKEALNLSDGRGMRIKDFSIAETLNSMVRAPTWKPNHHHELLVPHHGPLALHHELLTPHHGPLVSHHAYLDEKILR